jgi:hypothetical protein
VRKLPGNDKALLKEVGTTLFGENYRRPLARACGVSGALVAKWPPLRPGLLNEYLMQAVIAEQDAVHQREIMLGRLRRLLSELPTTATPAAN